MFGKLEMKMNVRLMAAFLVCVVAASGMALAHSGASGVVKQRMDAMSDIGKQTKAIGKMMQGQVAFDGTGLAQAARAIEAHAQQIPTLFPEGTNEKPSETLDIVWRDWARFSAIAEGLATSAEALAQRAEAASGPGDIQAKFSALVASCKECHQTYRQPKN
jgi:cytochrome c556